MKSKKGQNKLKCDVILVKPISNNATFIADFYYNYQLSKRQQIFGDKV